MSRMEERNLVDALRKMKGICKALRMCFVVATMVYLALWIVLLCGSFSECAASGWNDLAQAIYTLASGLFSLLILWNISQLFEGVVKDEQPFSELQADRLRSIAVIGLAYVALDLMVSIGFIYKPLPELGLGVVANDGISEPTINLNFGMLAFSAIMYSLSAIFRYAALLQQLSDDTV